MYAIECPSSFSISQTARPPYWRIVEPKSMEGWDAEQVLENTDWTNKTTRNR